MRRHTSLSAVAIPPASFPALEAATQPGIQVRMSLCLCANQAPGLGVGRERERETSEPGSHPSYYSAAPVTVIKGRRGTSRHSLEARIPSMNSCRVIFPSWSLSIRRKKSITRDFLWFIQRIYFFRHTSKSKFANSFNLEIEGEKLCALFTQDT